jgi:hypothetical protein
MNGAAMNACLAARSGPSRADQPTITVASQPTASASQPPTGSSPTIRMNPTARMNFSRASASCSQL